jgi:hypothetical protein
MSSFNRRAVFCLALLPAAFAARHVRAQAPAPVLLFKVVSPRDDIVVGIESAQLGTGAAPAVQRLAALLAEKWRPAPRGGLQEFRASGSGSSAGCGWWPSMGPSISPQRSRWCR